MKTENLLIAGAFVIQPHQISQNFFRFTIVNKTKRTICFFRIIMRQHTYTQYTKQYPNESRNQTVPFYLGVRYLMYDMTLGFVLWTLLLFPFRSLSVLSLCNKWKTLHCDTSSFFFQFFATFFCKCARENVRRIMHVFISIHWELCEIRFVLFLHIIFFCCCCWFICAFAFERKKSLN